MRGTAALLAAALLATGCAQNPEPAREPATTASAADVERAVPASDQAAVRPAPPEPQLSEPERPDPQAPDPADRDASTETHETDAPGDDQAGPGGSHDPDHNQSDGRDPSDGAASSWTVQYTAEGLFVPARLDLATGDEVVFVNSSDVPVWPASNIHPTHEILSSFDPQEVIRPGESWAYQFTENGYWRYHNHLEPSEVGLVVATGGPTEDLQPLVVAVEQLDFERPPADVGGEALFDDPGALADFVRAYGPAAAVAELKAVELETGTVVPRRRSRGGPGGVRRVRAGRVRHRGPRLPGRRHARRDRGAVRVQGHVPAGRRRRRGLLRRGELVPAAPVPARRRARADGLDHIRDPRGAATVRCAARPGPTGSHAGPGCSWRTWSAACQE